MAKAESKAAPAMTPEAEGNELARGLSAPFEVNEVRWKPQTVSGNRALAVAFVDARVIMGRLDDVVGMWNWQDSYERLPDGAVVCRLRIRVGDEWITKEDVGGQSEQPDEGDRTKAAFSDALKRAAVKFGIGRYLYRLKPQWVDYDPKARQIVSTPRLPSSAQAPAAAPAEKKPAAKTTAITATPARPTKGMPVNGEELHRRLAEKDRLLAEAGVCKAGDLVKHVVEAGVKQGLEKDLAVWGPPAIQLAIEEVRKFESVRKPAAAVKAA
jgi:hypothetical protein